MENSNYTFETYEDDYRRVWLDKASGTGEVIIIPEDIYGISPDAFRFCDGVKKVWIPERTKVIGKDAFVAFDWNVTIYCAAAEKPDAWFHKEDGITAWGFGADMSYDVVVNSWQGSYVYTCDNDDRIISMHNDRAKVVWGSKLEDLK